MSVLGGLVSCPLCCRRTVEEHKSKLSCITLLPCMLQVHLREVRHTDALSLFRTANPAFNKLAALLVYLVEHVRELLHEVATSTQHPIIE